MHPAPLTSTDPGTVFVQGTINSGFQTAAAALMLGRRTTWNQRLTAFTVADEKLSLYLKSEVSHQRYVVFRKEEAEAAGWVDHPGD